MSDVDNAPEMNDVQADAPQESSWINSLPEDLRDNESLTNFKTVGDLAKSYVEQKSFMGQSVRIPTEDSGEEARKAFYEKLEKVPGVVAYDPENPDKLYEKLGRPSNPDEYEFSKPEDFPDNIPVDENTTKQFKEMAHKLGLSKQQADALYKFDLQRNASVIENETQRFNKANSRLKEMWGDQYDNKIAAGNEAIRVLKEKYPEIEEITSNPLIGNNPAIVAILSEYGERFTEKEVEAGRPRQAFGMTPMEAQDKIQEIRSNPEHPFHNDQDPNHASAVERMRALYQKAYGSE